MRRARICLVVTVVGVLALGSVARGDWDAAEAAAQRALGFVPDAPEAKALLERLTPTLVVNAEVDGKPYSGAEIRVNGSVQESRTPARFRLEKGRTYEVEVSVPALGGKEYGKASQTVRADRLGVQTWTASLEGARFSIPSWAKVSEFQVREAQKAGVSVAKEVDLGGGVTMRFVFIPAGSFPMGSPASEAGRDGDELQHRVTLTKPFYLGKNEVTQGEWQSVMGSNPSHFKGSNRLPVEMVSWQDCQEFCRKTGLRLPTEAEWEYACRAGTETAFHTGATISTDEANYDGDSTYGSGSKGVDRGKTVEVGSFRPNAWGLHDMHGNVWEWCQDWHGEYPSGPVRDPPGPASGSPRVLRGGSWNDDPGVCRSANRSRYGPVGRDFRNGFRAAVDLK
ncbi:MAG: formylglycine-generating enzyme family protein [Planctomycetes bacterium]|nr:formylglycine-generating enzyme family protein [Planctomycetota bacterium]